MALSSRARSMMRRFLLATTYLCTLFAIASVFCTLAAGTMQVDGEYATGGPGDLLLSVISVVQFKGIISANDSSPPGPYLVTLHWFLNAFGWEYPTAPWEKSCGIVYSIDGLTPGGALRLPYDLVTVARRLSMPLTDYACLAPEPGTDTGTTGSTPGRCHNAFFAAWAASPMQRLAPTTSALFGTQLALWMYYIAMSALLAVFVQEMLFRCWPEALRCRCPRFMKGWCPCLKEGEEVSAAVCDRIRLWTYAVVACVYAAASASLGLRGLAVVRHLERVGVPGMDPQIGSGYLVLSAATSGVIILAGACVGLMMGIGYNSSWMDEQSTATVTGPNSGGKSD